MNDVIKMFVKATLPVVSIEQGHRKEHTIITFENGYKGSVITDGIGADEGLYELAVLDSSGDIDYTTHITEDVLGYLTPEDLMRYLKQISEL